MGIHKLNGVQEGQLKDKNFKFRLEIVPRPGVLQPPMFSPFRSILDERGSGMPEQHLRGSVDSGGEQRGLFLPFMSCVPLDKSLNHSESQFPHL